LGLLQAQRSAIRSGVPHAVKFAGNPAAVTSWTIVRIDTGGQQTVIDNSGPLSGDYTLQVDSSQIVFDFEGNGTSSFNARFNGPDRTWEVNVQPLTRMIDSHEVPR
jgi:hypothetical protein